MEFVSFPGFGINMHLNKIAFSIFNISIYWYAIFIISAIIIGLIFIKKNDGKYNVKYDDVLELFIFLIPVSIVFARIYYILFNLEYYSSFLEMIDLNSGGLAIYGGIIGGTITIAVFSRIKKINFLDITDYIVPYLALGQAIGRIGNFVNVEAYGTNTNVLWRMGIIENGQYIEVHPTFLYEMILTLSIFIFLKIMSDKRNFKGEITYLYLVLYSFGRFFIESIRTDSLMFFNLRISQLLSAFIFVIFCIIISKKYINQRKNKQNSQKNSKLT